MKIPTTQMKLYIIACALLLLTASPAHAFEFVPPRNIVSKERLPLKHLNLIRTKQGLTYLISEDGRYVFQGSLVDVWNGEAIESVNKLEKLSDQVNFKYLGISSDKMFTLDIGTGPQEVFIFSDPNCGVCHKLLAKIKASKLIQTNYRVHAVITPLLHETSMEKSKRLAGIARKHPDRAVEAFINNDFGNDAVSDEPIPGIEYNLLVANALGIRNFPYIVNSKGRIHVGMPDDIRLFLLE